MDPVTLVVLGTAALALLSRRASAPKALAASPSAPGTVLRDRLADPSAAGMTPEDGGAGAPRLRDATGRPPPPKFTDIGTVGYSAGAHGEDTSQVKTIQAGAKVVPIVGDAIATAVGIVAGIGSFASSILSSGNTAGLSPQQLEFVEKGTVDGQKPPGFDNYSQAERLAVAEGRSGTKQLFVDGQYVTVGGARFGGPGWTEVDAMDATGNAPPRTAAARRLALEDG